MKKVLAIITLVSLAFIASCVNDEAYELEKNDNYIPWWINEAR